MDANRPPAKTTGNTPAVAIVVSVCVAVAGWLVNQWFARRALRRNMRIDYLLSAYRRLEHASNRSMTSLHEEGLEAAVSDIQLLGSPQQVQLAIEFAEAFAAQRQADTEPLLQDLRASLRRELLLEAVPPQRMWLRIASGQGRGGPSVSSSSTAQWRLQEEIVTTALATTPVRVTESVSNARRLFDEMAELARTASPIAAIGACRDRLGQALAQLLAQGRTRLDGQLSLAELSERAHRAGLIADGTRTGIDGLDVMYRLALLDPQRVGVAEAEEYATFTEGVLFALRSPLPRALDALADEG